MYNFIISGRQELRSSHPWPLWQRMKRWPGATVDTAKTTSFWSVLPGVWRAIEERPALSQQWFVSESQVVIVVRKKMKWKLWKKKSKTWLGDSKLVRICKNVSRWIYQIRPARDQNIKDRIQHIVASVTTLQVAFLKQSLAEQKQQEAETTWDWEKANYPKENRV